MKLSKMAKANGRSYTTAWRWFKTGNLQIKVVQTESGTILVEPNITKSNT